MLLILYCLVTCVDVIAVKLVVFRTGPVLIVLYCFVACGDVIVV